MFNYKDEIINIEKKILTESKKRGMIENGNYILAMELKEIREGRLNSVEDIAKWCFEMIKTGELVKDVMKEEWEMKEKGRNFKKKMRIKEILFKDYFYSPIKYFYFYQKLLKVYGDKFDKDVIELWGLK